MYFGRQTIHVLRLSHKKTGSESFLKGEERESVSQRFLTAEGNLIGAWYLSVLILGLNLRQREGCITDQVCIKGMLHFLSQVMLISLSAGGVGLNLTGGNHLFLLDMHW